MLTNDAVDRELNGAGERGDDLATKPLISCEQTGPGLTFS